MTVINNIEIDDIKYCENEIKAAICNNEPIEEKLNVIIVVSNPCQYGTRYLLAREFVRRMELEESNVELYIVELADRKSTRLNSSHITISYAVFCLNKNKHINITINRNKKCHREP